MHRWLECLHSFEYLAPAISFFLEFHEKMTSIVESASGIAIELI